MFKRKIKAEEISEAVEELYTLSRVIGATLSAQAYLAQDVHTNGSVCVWRTRGPIASSDISRFKDRLTQVSRAKGVQPILRAGIDRNGVGFAVLPEFKGRKITIRAEDRAEIESRFKKVTKVVEGLHSRSITCGDLCLDSFVLNDREEVSLFSVLGDVRLISEDEEFNQNIYLAFRPPEQGRGGAVAAGADLYALGWIAEGLFGSKSKEDLEPSGEDSERSSETPKWLKRVLQATATPEGRSKASSSRTILKLMEDSDDSQEDDQDSFALAKVDQEKEKQRGYDVEDKKPRAAKEEEQDNEKGQERKKRTQAADGFDGGKGELVATALADVARKGALLLSVSKRMLALLAANIVALGVLMFTYYDMRLNVQPKAIEVRQAPPLTKAELMVAAVAKLEDSNDREAHATLLQMFEQAQSPLDKELVRSAVLNRARRVGLRRASDLAFHSNSSLFKMDNQGGEELASTFLQMLDPALNQESRTQWLQKLYETNPRLATVLAAALALDLGDAESYRGLLARAAVDQVGTLDAGEHSPLAVLLLLPDTNALFSEDLIARGDKISASDILWLLEEHSRRGGAEISTIAQLALSRNVITGARVVFLRELSKSAGLSSSLRVSLAAGALGKLGATDVQQFSNWYGERAVRVLEASMITAQDQEVTRSAFEALGAKPINDVYIMHLIEFVRRVYDDKGWQLGPILAAIALRESLDEGGLNRELLKLKGVSKISEMLKTLAKGAPAEVVVAIINVSSDDLEPVDLIDLLSHKSSDVRRAALVHLSDVNDIFLQKLILQSYETESDASIRAVYEEKFSLIKERRRV